MDAVLAYLIALSQHLSAETKQNHKQSQHNSFLAKVQGGDIYNKRLNLYIS
jgi:hypothetical protein